MADIAERRRQKLLARSAQLSSTGANPLTKPVPAVSLNQTQLPAEHQPLLKSSQSPEAQPIRQAPKVEVIDYKALNKLMEQKDTFQTSKKINRVGISFILGVVFHYFYVAAHMHYCSLGTFIPTIIVVYYLMEEYERRNYQNPISLMLKRGGQKVESSGFDVTDFIQGETGQKVNQLFSMIEMFSTNSTVGKLMKYLTYLMKLKDLISDIAVYICGCLFIDAVLRAFYYSTTAQ